MIKWSMKQSLKGGLILDNDLLSLDATSIHNKIVSGTISSVEIAEIFIRQQRGRAKSLNAIVEERYEKALDEAKKADQHLHEDKEPIGPLHGVPICVKESFDVEGMKTTGGLLHLKNHTAQKDAHVIQKLKKAGAIILCKTNTSTLCYAQESVNKLYGRTNNPWEPSRTAGGSSGGEGALLAIGGAAIGIGSDIGGSIRFPSHMNGVIGFKAGKFQVDQTGHFPQNVVSLQKRMSSIGPMGKSVRDMRLVYDIIAKRPAEKLTTKEINIEILSEEQPFPISEKTKDLLYQIKRSLLKTFTVKEKIPPFFEESALLWQEMMSVNGSEDIKKIAFNGKKKNIVFPYLREKLMKNTDHHEYLLWAILGSTLFKPSDKRVQEINQIIKTGDIQLKQYFQNKVLILPVYHTGARKHGKVFKEIFSITKSFKKYMPYTAYANVWGLPSLTIPVGVDEEDMPIGVQILSVNGNEDLIFSIGEILEKEFRGYKRNINYDSHS